MKAVILAGGLGTRLSEETVLRPKPMVEIGGMPILWHIMKLYQLHGVDEFIVCCGYKGYMIKEFFSNYSMHRSDLTIDFRDNTVETHEHKIEPWKVTLIDTGEETMTGGRLKRIAHFLQDEETFLLTYGDGVSDVNISESIAFHQSHGRLATVTAAFPPGRFGALEIENNQVIKFQEKPKGDGGLINAGFFVLSVKALDYIESDETVWEETPLVSLAADNELMAFKHTGFWHPMDTLRDKKYLDELCSSKVPPWLTINDNGEKDR